MLPIADHREKDFTAAASLRRQSLEFLSTQIWLPKKLYDGLPFFYMFAGLTALTATIYVGAWYWILPHYMLCSATCLHLCAAILRKRRKFACGVVEESQRDEAENQT